MFRTKLALAACVAALSLPASAHEVDCRQEVGLVPSLADGTPARDASGLPAATTFAPLLVLAEYPAFVAVRSSIHNTHALPSVIDTAAEPLLSSDLGLSSPLSLPLRVDPGAVATATHRDPIRIDSLAQCIALGGRAGSASATAPYLDVRLVLGHARGGAECRARIVCLPPLAQ